MFVFGSVIWRRSRQFPAQFLSSLRCFSAFPVDDTNVGGHLGESDSENEDNKRWYTELAKPHFSRIILTPSFRQIKHESVAVFESLRDALDRRESYRTLTLSRPLHLNSGPPTVSQLSTDAHKYTITSKNGVLFAEGDPLLEELNATVPTVEGFHTDVMWLWGVCMSNPVRQVADRRLNILDLSFKFHGLSNGYLEYDAQKLSETDVWRGAYQFVWGAVLPSFLLVFAVAKVDNHCHAASLMTCTHLLDFMRRKAQVAKDDVVLLRGREPVTLGQLFKEKECNFDTLSVCQLDVRMRDHMFYRCRYMFPVYY
jgi:hypothetical protein